MHHGSGRDLAFSGRGKLRALRGRLSIPFLSLSRRVAALGLREGRGGPRPQIRHWKPKLFLLYDLLRKYSLRSNQLPTLEVSFC